MFLHIIMKFQEDRTINNSSDPFNCMLPLNNLHFVDETAFTDPEKDILIKETQLKRVDSYFDASFW